MPPIGRVQLTRDQLDRGRSLRRRNRHLAERREVLQDVVAPLGGVLHLNRQAVGHFAVALRINATRERLPRRLHLHGVGRALRDTSRRARPRASGRTSSGGPTAAGGTTAETPVRARREVVEHVADGREVLAHGLVAAHGAVEPDAVRRRLVIVRRGPVGSLRLAVLAASARSDRRQSGDAGRAASCSSRTSRATPSSDRESCARSRHHCRTSSASTPRRSAAP